MLGQPLLKFPPLQEGVLIKRYKRFLADVRLDSGKVVTAHCANTGPMKGVLAKECRVRLKYVASPSRKLDWSWEQAEVLSNNGSFCWVGVNTALANKLVKLAIEFECLKNELGSIAEIRQEVVYGINRGSRIDFLLYPSKNNSDQRKIYIEVKNTTWAKGLLALFPDTITKRGQKHLKELMNLTPKDKAILIPCIARNDLNCFAPGDSADQVYGKLFRKSLKQGVQIIPCSFGFYKDNITWEGVKIFQDHQ